MRKVRILRNLTILSALFQRIEMEERKTTRYCAEQGAKETRNGIPHNERRFEPELNSGLMDEGESRLAVGTIQRIQRRQKCHRKGQAAYYAGQKTK